MRHNTQNDWCPPAKDKPHNTETKHTHIHTPLTALLLLGVPPLQILAESLSLSLRLSDRGARATVPGT